MIDTSRTPPKWGNDGISSHLDMCRTNQYATFHNKPEFQRLREIDQSFRIVFKNAVNPRPMYPMPFLLRSHSNFLAASSLVLAGHVFESHALMRLCLESAAYGFYVGDNKDRYLLWLNREADAGSKAKTRTAFSNTKISEHISTAGTKLKKIYDQLYQQSIDYGAHPNERGFSINTNIGESDGMISLDQVYLQADGIPLDHALKSLSRVGCWCLSVYQLLYKTRWELLGIKKRLEEHTIDL
jgi:hypothetical protein